jgi:hypothetical protein
MIRCPFGVGSAPGGDESLLLEVVFHPFRADPMGGAHPNGSAMKHLIECETKDGQDS